MSKRTYDTDEITLRKVYAFSTNNQFVPAMTVLTADGAGGTYWAIPSSLGYNPSFNQIATDAGTFTASAPYNTFTLSQGGGIGFVQGEGTNQMYIYSKGFGQINTVGGNSLSGFSNNVTTPVLNFAGSNGISLQANPVTNTLTFTGNGIPISTTLNSFQSLKIFANLSTPTTPASLISSLGGATILYANNYSSILTLAGTGQISLTPDYLNNTVYVGLNASTLVTSNLTSIVVSTTSVQTSSFTLIDTYSKVQKTLYSYNGNLYLNGIAVSGAAASLVASVNPGSNIIMGPTGTGGGTQGDVTVNVDMTFLGSTVQGLGSSGYISTLIAANLTGIVSTANLANLVSSANLAGFVSTANLAGLVSTNSLISTVAGLGTAGYLSSLKAQSLSTGTLFTSSISFIDTTLNTKQLLAVNGGILQLNGSPITGGGGGATGNYVSTANLFGLISTANLAKLVSTNYISDKLGSTVQGLGTVGYFSSSVFNNVTIVNSTSPMWVAVGTGSSSAATIQYSLDGFNFSSANRGGFDPSCNVATSGGIAVAFNSVAWVATGFSSTGITPIQRSIDGSNWDTVVINGSGGNTGSFNAVAWNGVYWLATSAYNNCNGSISISVDPYAGTWNDATDQTFLNGYASCIAWNGMYWLVGGSNRDNVNNLYSSPDSLTWTSRTTNGFSVIRAVAWNGSYWLAVGSNDIGGTPIQFSYNAINWSNANSANITNIIMTSAVWNGSYWYVGATSGDIYFSYDGSNWALAPNRTTFGSDANGVTASVWNGDRWLATGFDLVTNIRTILVQLNLTSSWLQLTTGGFTTPPGGSGQTGRSIAFSSNTQNAYKQANLSILPQAIPLFTSTNQLLALSNSLTINSALTINTRNLNNTGYGSLVGINTGNPQYTLDVRGSFYASSVTANTFTGSSITVSSVLTQYIDATGIIRASLGVLSNGTFLTSDRRIKQDIRDADLERCYSNLVDLPLRSFSFISSFSDTKLDKHQIGFIADELSTLFPKSIYEHTVGFSEYSTIQLVNYEQVQMAHFGATQYMASLLQNQNSTIVAQNAVISSLEQQMASLSTSIGLIVSK